MSQSYSETLVAPSPTVEEALAEIRTLWHYLPDYDYRPDLFVYAEFHTTDPGYVVVGVGGSTPAQSNYLMQIKNALDICLASVCDPPARGRALYRVDIAGIPEHMFASRRLTSVLIPDLAVWACLPSTPHPHDIYWFDRDGAPWLVLEVVTPGTKQERAHDMAPRRIAYARMGVREFWLLDTRQDFPLMGYTLDAADAGAGQLTEYRRMIVAADGGQASRVLDNSLRWVDDYLEGWKPEWGGWVRVVDIPSQEADAHGRAEERLAARLDLLLAMGVSFDDSRELGLDLLCLDTVPGVGALMRTQGDQGQLRLHIPRRPPDKTTAEDDRYVTALLRTCPTYRLNDNDYTGPG